MSTVVGASGLEGYPSLQSICDLFRSLTNDTFDEGTGQISTNDAPWIKPFLNSAIRDLYSELRITGDMRVIRDNVVVSNLAPVTAGNPATQVALTYAGYFNGTSWNNLLRLPADLMWLEKLWQRPNGVDGPFFPLYPASSGIAGIYQADGFLSYEVRGQNELWLSGASLATDLRLRYQAVFPDIVASDIDFSNTYVPLMDSTNAITQKMVANYCQRMSPEQYELADSRAKEFVGKMKAESILNSQSKEFERREF